ncbi:hypothetical protein DMA15_33735 [Streptomyces sp. WAC 01529]|nr:hypothetical protein DMA15_33735 [Streptomyces sp. WAC 01529]
MEKLAKPKDVIPKPGAAPARHAPGEDIGPPAALLEGSLNKACVNLPSKVNAQSVLALVNVGVQDIDVLANPMTQQCVEKTTANGDEPLAKLIETIPVLSGNVSG